MLINLTLICKGYLHDVLISRPETYITQYSEMYGRFEHGRTMTIDDEDPRFNSMISLFTYVNGVKHGKYYHYPSKLTLVNILNTDYSYDPCYDITYGYIKNNKSHGMWRCIYAHDGYRHIFYKNHRILRIDTFNKNKIVMTELFANNYLNNLVKRYWFHTNGRIQSFERFLANNHVRWKEYDDQGRQI